MMGGLLFQFWEGGFIGVSGVACMVWYGKKEAACGLGVRVALLVSTVRYLTVRMEVSGYLGGLIKPRCLCVLLIRCDVVRSS
jgi:hypothetical protein